MDDARPGEAPALRIGEAMISVRQCGDCNGAGCPDCVGGEVAPIAARGELGREPSCEEKRKGKLRALYHHPVTEAAIAQALHHRRRKTALIDLCEPGTCPGLSRAEGRVLIDEDFDQSVAVLQGRTDSIAVWGMHEDSKHRQPCGSFEEAHAIVMARKAEGYAIAYVDEVPLSAIDESETTEEGGSP